MRAEIEEDGGTVSTHACDIRDEEGVIATVQKVLDTTGRIDGLVNNAGGQYRAGLEDDLDQGFRGGGAGTT